MITANQPQVTNRPLHVRCSNQPIGLRSSFRSIQRRKKATHTMGVQNVFSHHTCAADGGSSCQTRSVFRPASVIASAKASRERDVTRAMDQSNCPTDGTNLR